MTIKDRWTQNIIEQRDRYLRFAAEYQELLAKTEEVPELDYNSLYTAFISYDDALVITLFQPGDAQEVANMLSSELGMVMSKEFNSSNGEHVYRGEWGGLKFRVQGEPPEKCELKKIVEVKEVVRYEVVCDD